MLFHARKKLVRERVAGCGADDGIDAASRAEGGVIVIDPLYDLGRLESLPAIEAAALFTPLKFCSMSRAVIVGRNVLRCVRQSLTPLAAVR